MRHHVAVLEQEPLAVPGASCDDFVAPTTLGAVTALRLNALEDLLCLLICFLLVLLLPSFHRWWSEVHKMAFRGYTSPSEIGIWEGQTIIRTTIMSDIIPQVQFDQAVQKVLNLGVGRTPAENVVQSLWKASIDLSLDFV